MENEVASMQVVFFSICIPIFLSIPFPFPFNGSPVQWARLPFHSLPMSANCPYPANPLALPYFEQSIWQVGSSTINDVIPEWETTHESIYCQIIPRRSKKNTYLGLYFLAWRPFREVAHACIISHFKVFPCHSLVVLSAQENGGGCFMITQDLSSFLIQLAIFFIFLTSAPIPLDL